MNKTRRIPEVNEAKEIVIELGERGGDLENLKRAAGHVVGGHEAFLRTAARRLKYEYLLWRIVAKGDVGKAPGARAERLGIFPSRFDRIVFQNKNEIIENFGTR